MSLVNDSLKFTSSDSKYAEIFCWKNVSYAKATHIFSAKNIRILYIECTKIVNEITLNELVKLTMLWTTGPWRFSLPFFIGEAFCQPRWLSWMRRPTGDQEVAGSTPAEAGNILSWWLIMEYFLRSFSPFRWFKKGSCQFLAQECAQYWLTA